ncbi:MAG: transporter substrate-binding domain-containing protein [Pseudonocardiaceae bacterium]|nr:transporter substrate-binding domain-containing protein [Pseudonocardiaceae bacterium]
MPELINRVPLASGSMSRRGFLGRSAALMAALTAGGGVVSACGGDSTGSGGSGEVTLLTILPLETLSFAPELLAKAGGHFKDQGINVTFESTRGSAQAVQMVLSGGAYLTWIGQIECMIANRNKGADLRAIGTASRRNGLRFVSSEKSPLRKPEDFAGKTIGVPSEGGTSELTLDLVLQSADIDPKKVQRQVVGLTPGIYNLVQNGRIDGFTVSLDTALTIQQQHPDAVSFDPGEVLVSGGQVYVSTPDGMEENRDSLQRYLGAINTSMKSIVDDAPNFEKTLKTLRGEYSFETLKNDEVAVATLKDSVAAWTLESSRGLLETNQQDWSKAYQELTEASIVKPGGDPGSWIVNDLLPSGQ